MATPLHVAPHNSISLHINRLQAAQEVCEQTNSALWNYVHVQYPDQCDTL